MPLGYDQFFEIKSNGMEGGLYFCWVSTALSFDIIYAHDHFLFSSMKSNLFTDFKFQACWLYGYPHKHLQNQLWNHLQANWSLPTLLV